MGVLQEFKSFALRGNVIDLAVAVIMGTAFGSVVNSLVQDVVMPPLGAAVSSVNFADLYIPLYTEAQLAKVPADKLPPLGPNERYSLKQIKDASLPVIGYGAFLSTIINFLIVAFAVFLLVKSVTYGLSRVNVSLGPPPPSAPPQEKLLAEIRDLLKERAGAV